jgi:ferredoxin
VPAPGAPVAVRLAASARTVAAAGPGTLLEQLERAGERPAYGCRIGICQTCKCRKQSGVVENLRTGAISSDPDEDIQLCISRARSDLELAL